MPISVVVGGQYGSEGKGKVALELARRNSDIKTVVRPGGTNSGHTGYSRDGDRIVLRQLPAAAIAGDIDVILPPGSYIDVDIFLREVETLSLTPDRVKVDPRAHIIRSEHIEWERNAGLIKSIGSTSSGTGAAVMARLARYAPALPAAVEAGDVDALRPFIAETTPLLMRSLSAGERILIEGTQGFGLSPIHGDEWPKCTSRDTTAAAFVAEAGLSPMAVDQIVLVLRCHPIRVAGDSGSLVNETTWSEIARQANCPESLTEFTSVTHKVRRVGLFDPEVVKRAIAVNSPTQIVLNHVDYVDWAARDGLTPRALSFIRSVEEAISASIDWVGLSPDSIEPMTPAINNLTPA